MDPAQFKTLVLACTTAESGAGASTRKYDEEAFAQRVIQTASKDGELKQEVAASMIKDLLVELAHSWTQGFDFFRMFFGYLIPTLPRITRVSLVHQLTSALTQQVTLLAYAAQREWLRHLCEIVPIVYDIIILGEISQLMKTLGAFSCSQHEMKWLLRLLDSTDKKRPPWWTMIIEVMEHIFQPRLGPDAFFTFFSKEGGFTVPMADREVGYAHGYTFAAWIYIEDLPKHHQPCIYSFMSDNGEGFECFFIGNTLTFRTRVTKKKLVTQKMAYKFLTRQWYFVVITHSYRILFTSELSLYVDGSLIETAPLVYPKPDHAHPLTRCHIGNSHTFNQGFLGQMGIVTFFGEALNAAEVHTLYNLGPNQQPITNPSTTDVAIGYDGNEFCFDNRHSAKIVWCYNPKADEGLLVQDVATSSMAHSATLLDGCRVIISTPPARALRCAGGLASLLPMIYQLHHQFMDEAPPIYSSTIPQNDISIYHKIHTHLTEPAHVFDIFATVLQHNPVHLRTFHKIDGFATIALLLQGYQTGTSFCYCANSISEETVKAIIRLLEAVKGEPVIRQRAIETLILGSFSFWSRIPFLSQGSLLMALATEMQTEQTGVCPFVDILQNYYWLDDDHPSAYARFRENKLTQSEIKQLRMHILHIARGLARGQSTAGVRICNETDVKRLAMYLRDCSPVEIEDVLAALSEIFPSNDPVNNNFDPEYQNAVLIAPPPEKPIPNSLVFIWGTPALPLPPSSYPGTHHFNRAFLLAAEPKWKRVARARESILAGICLRCRVGLHDANDEDQITFWKIDRSEGPSRMRRKLKANYAGSRYRVLVKSKVGVLPPSEARARDLALWELSLPPPLDKEIVDTNAEIMSEFELLDSESGSGSNSGSLHHHRSSRGPIPPILLENSKDSPQKHRLTPNFSLPRALSTPLSSSTSSFRKQMSISPPKDKERDKDKAIVTLDVQMVTVFGSRKGRLRITNSYMEFIAFSPMPTTPLSEPPLSFAELLAKSPKLSEYVKPAPEPESDSESESEAENGTKSPEKDSESSEKSPEIPENPTGPSEKSPPIPPKPQELRSKPTGSRASTPEPRVRTPEPRANTPELRAKTPEPRIKSPRPASPAPQTPPLPPSLPEPPTNEDAPLGHLPANDKWTDPYEKDYYIWNLEDMTEIHRTRYLLRWVALEFFFTNRKNYFFVFSSEDEVKTVYNKIIALHPMNLTVKWGAYTPKKILKMSKLTDKWRRRKLTNFEYLMALNSIAGRSFNDLSQYPVFPHVLADYTSAELDLGKESTFRDLTKPVGALNETRLAQLKSRMAALSHNHEDESAPPPVPPFLYGSHYSSPGAVVYYLIRMEPFARLHLKLQSGVWDHTARLFADMGKMWDSVAGTNPADVKELTPEFFYMPEFLVNANEFQLGLPEKGDVTLPPWAKGSPDLFVARHREALESEYVSMNLHHWIDLIFGYKQRGPEAVACDNLFYHLTYEGAVNWDAIKDPMEKKSIELQILDFGQCPAQLSKKPHRPRMTLEELAKPSTRQLVLHTFSALLPPSLTNLASSKSHPAIYCYRRPADGGANLPLVHIGIPPVRKKGAGNVVLVYRDGVVGVHQYDTKEDRNGEDPVLTWALDKNVRARQFDSLLRSTSIVCIDNCFALTADGKNLLSCASWDYVFKCSAVNTGRVQRVWRGLHSGMVTCLALSSDGKTFATGSQDCSMLVWDDIETLMREPSTPPFHTIHTHSGTVSCIDINPEWDIIVSGSQDKSVAIHSLRTGKYVRSMPHSGTVEMVKVSTKSQVLVSYCSSSRLYVHSLNGKLLRVIETEKIFDMKLTTENYLVTGGTRGVKIYNLPDLEVVHEFRSATTIRTIAFVSRERFLLVGLEDGLMVIIRFDESQWRTSTT